MSTHPESTSRSEHRASRHAGPRARVALPLLLALGLAACGSPTPIPPRSPLALDNATPAMPAYVAASPTPGPLPSPSPAPTAVIPPMEPLTLPPGFGISVFADLGIPLAGLAVAPNGDVFASVPSENRILVLPDRDADGVMDADGLAIYAEGGILARPYGMDFASDALFVAGADGVLRFPYADGDLLPSGPAERILELPDTGPALDRSLRIGPDDRVYVGVGASCNQCEVLDDQRRAAVIQMKQDGGESKLYSAGLRRPLGIAFHPETGDVWAGDQGREGLGDELPPDELNRLSPGGHYGWPYCYGDRKRDSGLNADRAFCDETVPPMVELLAHAGVAGMLFYDGEQFPETYRGDLYVALSGSDNRRELPTGYNVVRIPMNGWAPRGEVFDFVSGWLRPDTRRWGSPTDLVLAPDGSMLISDSGGGRVYRVYHQGEPATETPAP